MTTQRTFGRAAFALGLALAVTGASAAVSAQNVDARWLPWIGCWTPEGQEQPAGMDLVCVQPSQQRGAVELLRVVDGAVEAREVMWADGARHDTSRDSCTGWEQGTFSQDGRRLFLKGEYTCDGVTQETGGVIAMATPQSWIDVRVAGMSGEEVAWVQRYQVAAPSAVEASGFGDLADPTWSSATARMVASTPLDVDDIIEAAALVSDEAVQALLAERGDRLDLSAAELVRMADAGVSEDVIDVSVAVSFPERFQLNTGPQEVQVSALDQGSLRRRWVGGAMGPAFYDPMYMPWSLRFGYGRGWYGYDPYGYGYGYAGRGYGGYGYGYGGFGGYGYTPTVVVVDPVRDHGRVVNGRGYSRGRSSGGSGGSYTPARSGSGGSGSRTARPSGGKSSGGTAARPSSSGSTRRTAKPRGGGGGI